MRLPKTFFSLPFTCKCLPKQCTRIAEEVNKDVTSSIWKNEELSKDEVGGEFLWKWKK